MKILAVTAMLARVRPALINRNLTVFAFKTSRTGACVGLHAISTVSAVFARLRQALIDHGNALIVGVAFWTDTAITVDEVNASTTVFTGRRGAIVKIDLTIFAWKDKEDETDRE